MEDSCCWCYGVCYTRARLNAGLVINGECRDMGTVRYSRNYVLGIRSASGVDESVPLAVLRQVMWTAGLAGMTVASVSAGCSCSPQQPSGEFRLKETDTKIQDTKQGLPTSRGMRLVEAISRICAPKGITPVWALLDEHGTPVVRVGEPPKGWEWIGCDEEGPRGSWQGDVSDPIKAIATWVEPYRIQDGIHSAGILLTYDKESKRLFLWRRR